MTPEQRLFNEAWEHILSQGEPSVVPGTSTCQYQTKIGLSCAFAPAIQDYCDSMEQTSAADMIDGFSDDLFPWARELNHAFANSVQDCHDTAALYAKTDSTDFLTDFKERMTELANHHELDIPNN